MKRYNVIVVYDTAGKKLLMCLRTKDPYKGKLNFVGGKVEPGETKEEAAYRELLEETGITGGDIILTHVMDFRYYLAGMELEIYSGILKNPVLLTPEVNQLVWVSRSEDFCDMDRFAGNCNIEHIFQIVDMYKEKSLKTGDNTVPTE